MILADIVTYAARLYILFLVGGLTLYYWQHRTERKYVLGYLIGAMFYAIFVIWRVANRQPESPFNVLGSVGAATIYHYMAHHNIRLYGMARGARAVARAVQIYDTHGKADNRD